MADQQRARWALGTLCAPASEEKHHVTKVGYSVDMT